MNIFLADEQDEPLSTDALRRVAAATLEAEGIDTDTEVTLMFVTDDVIAEYNAKFMGKAGPTDVLAFPLEHLQPGERPRRALNGPPINLGDVVIAPAYVRRSAESRDVAADDELALMIVHGILHLLGYDHPTDEAAAVMEERERQILATQGVRRP